ncbi:MAG: hypothetical protein BWY74_00811 [Firmicutes bacterium ADurb.Bin419]|nr:MAG: hypothetical protein BWY74_00811 [Firmicutes bacterium ADurb.Bin419]
MEIKELASKFKNIKRKVDASRELGWCLIPPWVAADRTLSANEKLVCGRIMGLVGKQGYCYASNKWLGRQLSLKEDTVGRIVSNLVERGIIKRTLMRDKETGQIRERRIYIHSDGYPTGFNEAINRGSDQSAFQRGGGGRRAEGSVALEGIGNSKIDKETTEQQLRKDFEIQEPLKEKYNNIEVADPKVVSATRAKLEQQGLLKPKRSKQHIS